MHGTTPLKITDVYYNSKIPFVYDYADKAGGALPVPTYFILDEFANIGRIPDFDKNFVLDNS